MAISRRTYLLLILVFVSLFAGWQGIGASYVAGVGFGSPEIGSGIYVTVPLQEKTPADVLQAEILSPPSDVSLRPLGSGVPLGRPSEITSELPSPWALDRIQALPRTWNMDTGSPVLVAVLDTGIDQGHEDLSGRVVAEIAFSGGSATDVYGHGTPIAGIIAADADNGLGVIGLAPASRLINIKVADDDGKCQLAALVAGIIWSVDHGASVINISIEMKEASSVLEEAIDYAWERGAIVVAAAGNGGASLPAYPAAYNNCLAVTAVQENGTLAPLANYADWVDCAAPGLYIYSTLPDNKYGYKHGTSFATAYVSGLAALLFSLAEDTNGDGFLNDEVRGAIEAGCEPVDIAGTGRGVINVPASIAALALNAGSLP